MRFDVITIFPEMFEALRIGGVVGRALDKQVFELRTWNPRDYTTDARKTVDDRAYGGGPGMVMMAGPLDKTVRAINLHLEQSHHVKGPVILLSPQGRVFHQGMVQEMLSYSQMTLVCGRYEAVDQRFIEQHVDFELSIGDFVVSGGEIPAMLMMDAMIRTIPGVLGDEESAQQDSFMQGLLDCPHYTRPENYENFVVPSVLLGGNHAKIAGWRREQSLIATQQHRPDLIESARKNGLLSASDELVLKQMGS
jgi:tRNA (guanine37-N1)-methyltransferase